MRIFWSLSITGMIEMIFHNYGLLFIHIPKTGGTSIVRALGSNEPSGHHPIVRDWPCLYQSACFVRNSWDRAVSCYCYLKTDGIAWYDVEDSVKYLKYDTFRDNILHWRDLGWLNQQHLRPQLHWIAIGNQVCIDFIGRFEKLQEDFDRMCEWKNIPKSKLDTLNASSHTYYADYYDDETKEIIGNLYRDEIELFDFQFAGMV